MQEKFIVTPKGYEALTELLQHLEVDERARIGAIIGDAVDDSKDLPENYAFRDAKLAQGLLEVRIAELKQLLKNIEIVEPSVAALPESVAFGTVVRVQHEEKGEVKEYTIVGTSEVSFYKGAISTASPVGKALLGHKVGDRVEVITPGGIHHYVILYIQPLR